MQPQDKDLESLNKFWHWADNERPDRDLFDKKATAGGPLTEEAQEAMQSAVEVVSLRAPDCLHPSGEVLRPAIKAVSFAIMYAWKMLRENPMIQKAIDKQETRDFSVIGDMVANFPNVPVPKPTSLNAILGRLSDFCDGQEITMTYPDGTERKGTIKHQGMGVYDFIEHTKVKDVIERTLGTPHPGVQQLPASPKWKDAQPAGDYAKCESECNRILNLLGASDVEVTVDKMDGRVMFYHRIYTGITYTLNYAPTVSSKSVEAAVSTLRKAALEEDRRRAF